MSNQHFFWIQQSTKFIRIDVGGSPRGAPTSAMGPTATSVAPEPEATMATFASFGAVLTGTSFSDLKIGQTEHTAAQWCTPRGQQSRFGPMGGAFCPRPSQIPVYCSRCKPAHGRTLGSSWRWRGGRCEHGGTHFSPCTRWAINFAAPGAHKQKVPVKYPTVCRAGPEFHHGPGHRGLAWAALGGGAGRPRPPKSWPQ